MGPGAADDGWKGALDKYRKAANSWQVVNLGMRYDARVYRVFVFSTLTFLAQLTVPCKRVVEAETAMLRKIVKGPGNWCIKEDLFMLKDSYGFSYAFPSIQNVARAAKLRVWQYESIDIKKYAEDIFTLRYTRFGRESAMFKGWYDSSYAKVLKENFEECRKCGVDNNSIRRVALGGKSVAEVKGGEIRIRKLFQATANDLLLHSPGYAEKRLRLKLARWKSFNSPDPTGVVVRRAVDRLSRVFKLTSPRVASSLLSTYYNRWTTSRRFQGSGPCRMCGKGEDSIEHTAH